MSRLLRLLLTASVAAVASVAVRRLLEQKSEQDAADQDDEELHFVKLEDEAESYGPQVKEIAVLYPYLSEKFIAAELAKNETYNQQFPTDTLVHVAYLIAFSNADKCDTFVKAVADKGYDVQVSEDLQVQVSRQFFTEDGAILSDIYNVANQAACLDGQWLDCTVSR